MLATQNKKPIAMGCRQTFKWMTWSFRFRNPRLSRRGCAFCVLRASLHMPHPLEPDPLDVEVPCPRCVLALPRTPHCPSSICAPHGCSWFALWDSSFPEGGKGCSVGCILHIVKFCPQPDSVFEYSVLSGPLFSNPNPGLGADFKR